TSPTMMSYRRTPRAKKRGASTSSIDITSPLTEAPKPYTTFSYDTNLYVEEKFKDTDYRYATIPRNEEFHKLFKSVSQSDRLLDDFSCALSRDILLQGRVYVSEHNICFNSNLLGWVTNLVIPLPDITGFEKTSTVGLFPNGIAISSKEGKNSFASFISRDGVFEFLETVWKASGGVPSTIDHSGDTQTSQVSSLLQKSSMTSDDVEEEQTDNSEVVEEKVSSQKVHVLKPDSKYSYIGTHGHGVTHCPYKPEDNKETILARVNLNCPPGVLYEFLFGSNFTMLNEFLRTQDSRDFSDVSEYETNADKKKERHYEYIKDLNYSVGPKQTRCIVTETIEHYDTDGYINVVNTTQTPDVPSGNAFCVKTRYIMTWGKGNTTDLVISYWVHWTGSSWMKSIIEKSTKGGQESAAKALLDKIKEVLEENIQESTEEVSTAVKADEEEQEEQEKAELGGSPVETVLRSTSPITTILEGVSIFNVLVIVLLSLIVVLQFQILRGLNGSSRLVFD
ncbi:GRAM and VASt domain-containing protein, partial [Cyberlindnera jadinii NRRL Y-1542]